MKPKIYLISDSHFGHSKMSADWGIRPVDYEELIEKGLRTIPDDGILIHLGDVSIGGDYKVAQILNSLKCKKWLIRGNHDGHPISRYVKDGWDFCGDEVVLKIFGHNVLLSHMPLPKRDDINKNIHGHLHGGKSHGYPDFYDSSYHQEICPEVVGYNPVRLGN